MLKVHNSCVQVTPRFWKQLDWRDSKGAYMREYVAPPSTGMEWLSKINQIIKGEVNHIDYMLNKISSARYNMPFQWVRGWQWAFERELTPYWALKMKPLAMAVDRKCPHCGAHYNYKFDALCTLFPDCPLVSFAPPKLWFNEGYGSNSKEGQE